MLSGGPKQNVLSSKRTLQVKVSAENCVVCSVVMYVEKQGRLFGCHSITAVHTHYETDAEK